MSDLVKQISIKNSSGDEWETREIGVDADNVEGLIDYVSNNLEATGVFDGSYGEVSQDQKTISILEPSTNQTLATANFTVRNDGRLLAASQTDTSFKPIYVVGGLEVTKDQYSDTLEVKMADDYQSNSEIAYDDDTLFTLGGARNLWDTYVNDHRGRKCYFGYCSSEASSTEKHVDVFNVEDAVFTEGTEIKILFRHGSNILNYSGYLTFSINLGSIQTVNCSLVNAYTLRCSDNTVLSFVYGGSQDLYLVSPCPTYLQVKEGTAESILGGEINTSVSQTARGYQIKSANVLEPVKMYTSGNDQYGLTIPAGKGILKFSFRTTATSTPMNLFFGVSTSTNPNNFSRGTWADIHHTGTNTSIDTSNIGSFSNELRYSSSDEIVLVVDNQYDTNYYLFAAATTGGTWIYPEYSYLIINEDHYPS